MFNSFRFRFWNLRLLNTSQMLMVGTNLPTTFVCDERPAVQVEGFILFRLRKSSQFSPKKSSSMFVVKTCTLHHETL
jgi:hypothetical protein